MPNMLVNYLLDTQEMLIFSVLQSTVAAQTLPLLAARRKGDLQPRGGTPGEARDQPATHRWGPYATQ